MFIRWMQNLLCINHAIKTGTIENYIFNITSCGGNAIAYLAKVMAKDIDIYTCIDHSDLGVFEDVPIEIDGRTFDNAFDAATYLIELQGE